MTGHGWKFDAAIGLIAEDGAVVENLDIQGGVQVLGNNVTIRNSRITLGGETMGISIRHAKNTLVEDTTVRSDGKDRLMVGVKDVYGVLIRDCAQAGGRLRSLDCNPDG